ncbi:MAG TPA: alpha/beta hydrolase [Gemmatimonas aurantiaca]|uniref:Alpha/beta hydrolase n=2 Tax=Gemmatimonas aurantiaca TaxID=173480 RepID=A0A3D4V9C2_9BACT|nr:alpha/beta hydrolase-fold protein [Gemmatimonas aurantiaca]HCT57723.1 alpha/beta hydrolase [Gemmatimonas aurantiaca]
MSDRAALDPTMSGAGSPRVSAVMGAVVGPVVMADAETWELESAHGVRYRLRVAWPVQPAPPSGYPVIYQLDGDATFATTVESMRTRAHRADATGVMPAIVVGVSYADDGAEHTAVSADDRRRHRQMLRAEDFTPALGASRFRTFLASVVQPAIASAFPVNAARSTLIGHSLGGLFVLDTLLEALGRGTSPEGAPPYQAYVAISPSIWRGGDTLWQAVAALSTSRPVLHPQVLITVGEYEQALAPWQHGQNNADDILERRRARRMVDQAREFTDRLNEVAPALDARCRVFAGEDHASVVLPSMSEALRLVGTVR